MCKTALQWQGRTFPPSRVCVCVSLSLLLPPSLSLFLSRVLIPSRTPSPRHFTNVFPPSSRGSLLSLSQPHKLASPTLSRRPHRSSRFHERLPNVWHPLRRCWTRHCPHDLRAALPRTPLVSQNFPSPFSHSSTVTSYALSAVFTVRVRKGWACTPAVHGTTLRAHMGSGGSLPLTSSIVCVWPRRAFFPTLPRESYLVRTRCL